MKDSKMQSLPDWAGLVTDLLEQIAVRLVIIEDFKTLRGVCTSWRSAVKKDKYINGMANSKVPLLLLLGQDNGEHELYSLSERRVCCKLAPAEEADGKRWLDVGFGWILVMDYAGRDMRLFKPLSRARAIQLPYNKTLLKFCKITQAVISDDPTTSNNFALSVLTMPNSKKGSYCWRNGDKSWTGIGPPRWSFICSSISNGMAYALDAAGCIWVWDLFGTNYGKMYCALKADKSVLGVKSNHLVVSTSGELLLISRRGTSHFHVSRIDIEREEWEVRNDLQGDAIFLSSNSPTSVAAAQYPGVLKPNCIYFANDLVGGKDMGIYNVQDQSLETFDFESVAPPPRSPLWISPSF